MLSDKKLIKDNDYIDRVYDRMLKERGLVKKKDYYAFDIKLSDHYTDDGWIRRKKTEKP